MRPLSFQSMCCPAAMRDNSLLSVKEVRLRENPKYTSSCIAGSSSPAKMKHSGI